jgi:hypothetical protein
MRQSRIAAVVLVTLIAAIGLAGEAQAKTTPEKVFAGKVLLSDKRFPLSARSPSAYIAKLRHQSKKNFKEDKENHQWKINFAAFFRHPLNDIELKVKIYDLSSGHQEFMASFDQYLDERGQKSFISSMILQRKQFGVNKQLLITLESHGNVLASGRFRILGEAEHHSGKVDFSDDDSQGGGGDEDDQARDRGKHKK